MGTIEQHACFQSLRTTSTLLHLLNFEGPARKRIVGVTKMGKLARYITSLPVQKPKCRTDMELYGFLKYFTTESSGFFHIEERYYSSHFILKDI